MGILITSRCRRVYIYTKYTKYIVSSLTFCVCLFDSEFLEGYCFSSLLGRAACCVVAVARIDVEMRRRVIEF